MYRWCTVLFYCVCALQTMQFNFIKWHHSSSAQARHQQGLICFLCLCKVLKSPTLVEKCIIDSKTIFGKRSLNKEEKVLLLLLLSWYLLSWVLHFKYFQTPKFGSNLGKNMTPESRSPNRLLTVNKHHTVANEKFFSQQQEGQTHI